MMWDFFERRVCLTLGGEEWHAAVNEFHGVSLIVEKFMALPDADPRQSFNKSSRQMLTDFIESDAQTLLIVEDDCVFKDLGPLREALRELPPDWDILYLGANVTDTEPQRVSKHLCRIKSAWTTHCISYSRQPVKFLLDNQPEDFGVQQFDDYLSGQLKNLNAYVVDPMVAWQRPHKSSLWDNKEWDDYSDIFQESQRRLTAAT